MDEPYTNYTERKGIFIDHRIFKGLINSTYSNYKNRDHSTRYSYLNTFKAVKRVREKAFGRLKNQPAEASTA
jgi:hypothetical protein